MYPTYDSMFKFTDPEEGAEFVNERITKINKIIDRVCHVDSVDEITDMISTMRDAIIEIEELYDDQLEEADNIMRSGPDPDAEHDGAID